MTIITFLHSVANCRVATDHPLKIHFDPKDNDNDYNLVIFLCFLVGEYYDQLK